MRTRDRADAVESGFDVRHPVPQRLVHGVLERLRPGFDRAQIGAQELHAEHVGFLPLDVDRAHIDDAIKAEACACGRGCDPMLTRTRLGDDPLLAHPPCQEDLAKHVVDLMRARVIELITLEIDLSAAKMRREPFGEIQRARPAHIVAQVTRHLRRKSRIGSRVRIGLLQRENQRHQRLSDETPTKLTKVAPLVGTGAERVQWRGNRHTLLAAAFSGVAASRAARMNARILSGSLSPAARSTPDETSTPRGRVSASARATFSGSRPPESMKGTPGSRFSTRVQSNALPSPPGRVAERGGRA